MKPKKIKERLKQRQRDHDRMVTAHGPLKCRGYTRPGSLNIKKGR